MKMANPSVQGFIMGLATGTIAYRLIQYSNKTVIGATIGLIVLGLITKDIIER